MRAALVLALVSSAAWAGWTAGPAPGGTPVDVQAYDGGYFVVTVNGGAQPGAYGYQWSSGAAVLKDSVPGAMCGGAFASPTCVVALHGTGGSGDVHYGAGCTQSTFSLTLPPPGGTATNGLLVRGARMGASFMELNGNLSNFGVYGFLDGNLTSTVSLGQPNGGTRAGSAISWDGGDYFLWNFSAPTLRLVALDAGTSINGASLTGPRDLALFDNGATLGAFGIDDGGTLARTPDVLTQPFTPVSVDGGFTTVDYTQLFGSSYGRGFGMAGAGSALEGPLPDPSSPGAVWVGRSAPSGAPTLVKVSCADPTFCVALDSSAQVWVYENANAPTLAAPAGPVFDLPVGTAVMAVPVIQDLDGDPVFVTWEFDGGVPSNLVLSPGGASATFTAPSCPDWIPLRLVVSDGYAPHDTPFDTALAFHRPAPAIANTMPVEVRAGGPGVDLTVAPGSVTGCPGETFTWTLQPGLSADGGTTGTAIHVDVPLNECQSTPLMVTVTAPDADGGVSTTFSVAVEPWGPPLTPDFAPPVATQVAGTAVFYDAGSEHVCSSTSGFPGTAVSGLVVDNPYADAGVTVDAGPGGVYVAAPNPCFGAGDGGAPITVTFARTVANPATPPVAPLTQTSDAGTLSVYLPSPLVPLAGVGFDLDAGYDAPSSQVVGDVSNVTNVVCAVERNLHTDVTVGRAGVVVADGGFPAPGPFALAVPAACAGTFRVTAVVTDDLPGSQPATRFADVDLPGMGAPMLGGLTGRLEVSCEGGGGVAQVQASGGCAAQTFSWKALDPSITAIDAGLADGLALISLAPGQLDALAGGQAPVEVTVANGPQTAAQRYPVPVVPARFVEVSHRKDPVQPSEEEPSGVEVLLHNSTSCPVTGIGLRESLDGLAVVKGTVRLDGVAVSSSLSGGVLSVDGITLPGHGTAHVTYLARVPLLANANPVGEAVMVRANPGVACALTPDNQCQYPVTLGGSKGVTPRACGCEATPDAAVLLLTLLGVLLRRRAR